VVRDPLLGDTLAHLRYLAKEVGPRGSTTAGERLGAEYAEQQLRGMGAADVAREGFKAMPSTYWGYAVSFTAAFTGAALVVVSPGKDVLILAVILNLLGLWGMLAESDVRPSWARWLLPKSPSQNVSGMVPPQGETQRRVVLCAHVDTHRTPVFYSSERWYNLFSLLVLGCFLSMLGGALFYASAAWWSAGALLPWARYIALIPLSVQAFASAMCIHADFTPYTPGANDNASGVAACLALAARARREPLQHTALHIAITGCEETGDWGMAAYLHDHAAELGEEPLFIILDEVGLGDAKFLTRDGLIVKHATHPLALEYARRAYAANPSLRLTEGPGLAYTDALVVTQHGLPALTVCTIPPKGQRSHWHQMSDTVETVRADDLKNVLEFAWGVVREVDKAE
jgi:hypothetical protein